MQKHDLFEGNLKRCSILLQDLLWADLRPGHPGKTWEKAFNSFSINKPATSFFKFSIPGSRVDFRKTIFWILDDLCQKKTASYHGARYINNPPKKGVSGSVHFLGLFSPGQGGDFLRQIATHHGPQTKGVLQMSHRNQRKHWATETKPSHDERTMKSSIGSLVHKDPSFMASEIIPK